MKNFFSTLLTAVLWVLIVLLMFLTLSGIYQRLSKGNTGFFGIGYAVVVSGSMEPSIHVNDVIVYMAHDKEDYEVGDCVVYARQTSAEDEILIIHRIISIDGDNLVTKGDANTEPDSPITFSAVTGRVAFRIPYLGVVIDFLRTPWGLIVIGAVIAGLVVLNIVISRKKDRKKPKTVPTVMGDQKIEY